MNADLPLSDNQLMHEIYLELKRLARTQLARERAGQTWQATDLVHEVYLKLRQSDSGNRVCGQQGWLSLASVAIRHLLVDRARQKLSLKRGGGRKRELLIDDVVSGEVAGDSLLRLDDALTALALHDPDAAQIVQLQACRRRASTLFKLMG